MEALLRHLNRLTLKEQRAFAKKCGTTIGYLRKAIYVDKPLGAAIVIAVEKQTRGKVRCEELRPDMDWAYLRRTYNRSPARISA